MKSEVRTTIIITILNKATVELSHTMLGELKILTFLAEKMHTVSELQENP